MVSYACVECQHFSLCSTAQGFGEYFDSREDHFKDEEDDVCGSDESFRGFGGIYGLPCWLNL